MKIVMVTLNYAPYSGGVVSSLLATTEALTRLGHSVHTITLDFLGNHEPEPQVTRLYCPLRWTYQQKLLALPWRPYKTLHEIIAHQKPDIIHLHHPFILAYPAIRAARDHRIPILFTHHTLYESYAHYAKLPAWLIRPFIRKIVRKVCNSVDAVIAPSSSTAAYIATQNIKTPVQVIPSGILPVFYVDKPIIRPLPEHLNSVRLIVVSRFNREKNLFFLLEVLALLPSHYTLTLIGFGDQEAALRHYAAARGVAQRTTFVIKPPREYIAELYRSSHLFLFSSVTETQGLVVTEAMASGLPVIALDGPGVRDIVISHHNGMLVFVKDEMVAAIIRLMNDQKLYRLWQENAWHTAQNYKTEVTTSRLIECYRSLASSRR